MEDKDSSLLLRDNGPINILMFRGGSAVPCLLNHWEATTLMFIKKMGNERKGKQSHASFAHGVTALPDFAEVLYPVCSWSSSLYFILINSSPMLYLLRRRQLHFCFNLILKEEQSHVLFTPEEAAPLSFDMQKKSVLS